MGLAELLVRIEKHRQAICANEKELPSFENVYGDKGCFKVTTKITNRADDGSYEPVVVISDRYYYHGFSEIRGLREAVNKFFDEVLGEEG